MKITALARSGLIGKERIRKHRVSPVRPVAHRPDGLLMSPAAFRNAGLLMLRLVVGATFVVHGVDKLIYLSAAERYFASLSIPAPGLMAPIVAITETVGGVLLIAGLAAPLVGLALAGDMLVALVTAHIDQGFFVDEGGFELVLVLGGASLAIALTGAGRFSVDAAWV